MKFVIWGAGERGRRICYHIGSSNVVAFIDMDKNKIGKMYENIEVIDLPKYKRDYQDICIVISTHESEVVDLLIKNNIFNYFLMSECPENFQSANPRMNLKSEIQKEIDKKKQYMVYGKSLYSILLYEWLLELNMVHQPYIFLGNEANKKLIDILKGEWGEYAIANVSEIDIGIDEVIITVDSDALNIKEDIPKIMQEKIRNVLRYSERIEAYHNKKIEKYKNIHRGRRCFVIGLGPSLTREDLDTLHKQNEICISMNSIYKIFEKTDWRPTYYITTDYRVMKYERMALAHMENIDCFISDENALFCDERHDENVVIYHLGRLWKEEGYIPFTEDFSRVVYNNGTVTYCAIELAVYLGCTEIYLLGTDASGINGKYEKYGHFYYEKEMESICFSKQVFVSYISAKKYADEHNISIYNASRGGNLEVFERVDFDSLFNK